MEFFDKEMRVVLETGEMKPALKQEVVTHQGTMDILPTDPAVAMRVLGTFRRAIEVARREVEEDKALCIAPAGDPTGQAGEATIPERGAGIGG